MSETDYSDPRAEGVQGTTELFIYMEFQQKDAAPLYEMSHGPVVDADLDPIAIGSVKVNKQLVDVITTPDSCALEIFEHCEGGVSANLVSSILADTAGCRDHSVVLGVAPVDTAVLRESTFPESFGEFVLFLIGIRMIGYSVIIKTSMTPPDEHEDPIGRKPRIIC